MKQMQQRQKQDRDDQRRLNKVMPYKPEIIHGIKQCQYDGCDEILQFNRMKMNSLLCDECDVIIEHHSYSCTSKEHEYDLCPSCYQNM